MKHAHARPRQWRRWGLALLGAGGLSLVGAAVATALTVSINLGGTTVKANVPLPLPSGITGALDATSYLIRTQHVLPDGSCGDERTFPATIAVAQALDVDGNSLPDVTVLVTATPGAGPLPTTASITVSPTPVVGQPRTLVEAILSPSGDDSRVAAGVDGCEKGLPGTFTANVTKTASNLTVQASTQSPTAALRIFGSTYTAAGSTRVDPLTVSAHVTPVPSTVKASIDTLAAGTYHAAVHTSKPTVLGLSYGSVTGLSSTALTATATTFPGDITVDYSPSAVAYTTPAGSAAMDGLDLDLLAKKPADATHAASNTHVHATLSGVPASGTLSLLSPTHYLFTAPTKIGTAVVTVSSSKPGVTVPTLAADADQYVVANNAPGVTAAQASVTGLTRAEIDTADPVLVDVAHTAGLFHIDAKITGSDGAVRTLHSDVANLPATAKVTYSPSTQAFSYHGASAITKITADVSSSTPLVANATASHLTLTGVPVDVTGQLDTVAQSFTADLPSGAIGTVEAQVTSGPDTRLADGQQGILINADDSSYVAFVRVLGVEHAHVTWGTTKGADLTHTAGPFLVQVLDHGRSLTGRVNALPHVASASFGPAPGGGGQQEVRYSGSDPIASITADSSDPATPLFGEANEAHLSITGLPVGVTVDYSDGGATVRTSDGRTPTPIPGPLARTTTGDPITIETGLGTIDTITFTACSTGDCPLIFVGPPGGIGTGIDDGPPVAPPTPPDGVTLSDHPGDPAHGDPTHFVLSARITGVQKADLAWGGDSDVLNLTHTGGPFELHVTRDRTKTFTETPPSSPPPTGVPGDPNDGACLHPSDCPEPSEDPGSPAPPVTHVIPYVDKTDVVIHELPSEVALTYDAPTGNITYHGDDVIGSIEATHALNSTSPAITIFDHAKYAHTLITGIPEDVTLTMAPGSGGLTLDTGGTSIGHIAVELLNTPAVLTLPYFATSDIYSGTADGALYWNLADEDPSTDVTAPVNSPFAIIVRVTHLQHFAMTATSTTTDTPDVSDTTTARTWAITRAGTAPPAMHVVVALYDPSHAENDIKITGTDIPYFYDSLDLSYAHAPHTFSFTVSKHEHTSGDITDRHTTSNTQIAFTGSEPGGPLVVDDFLDGTSKYVLLTIPTTPASTDGSPSLTACIASETLDCDDRAYDHTIIADSNLSTSVHVAQPTTFQILQQSGAKILTGDLDLDKSITFSLQDQGSIDTRQIYLDTEDTNVDATLTYQDTSSHLPDDVVASVHLPQGTHIRQRVAAIGNGSADHPRGYWLCPAGTKLDIYGVDDLADSFCSGAAIDSLALGDGQTTPTLVAGHTYTVNLTGLLVPWSPSSAGPCELGDVSGCVVGTSLYLSNPDKTTFPSSGYPGVTFGPLTYTGDGSVTTQVQVADDATPGTYALWAHNPIDESNRDDYLYGAFNVAPGS